MRPRIHGHGRRETPTRTWRIWSSMRARCADKRNRGYGARGIAICNRWDDFRSFLADMGECPSDGHSIDRIDNNGNYEPGNCRWATTKQQNRNQRNQRRLVVNGASVSIPDAAEMVGLPYTTLIQRLTVLKWEETRALWTPRRITRRTA